MDTIFFQAVVMVKVEGNGWSHAYSRKIFRTNNEAIAHIPAFIKELEESKHYIEVKETLPIISSRVLTIA